jgi:hypothetical protein
MNSAQSARKVERMNVSKLYPLPENDSFTSR